MSDSGSNDFSREPVPEHRQVNGWYVALIVFGIGFTLPIYLLGAELGVRLGLEAASLAFVGGCAVTGVLASLTSYAGARARLSSYVLIQFAFGRMGAKVVNALMAAALLGYYASTADIFGRFVSESVLQLTGARWPQGVFTSLGSVLMTITATMGFRAITRLSTITVPTVAVFMACTVALAVHRIGWPDIVSYVGQPGGSLSIATSTVIGSCVVGAIVMPDLCRFARSGLDGIKAAAGSTLGYPVIFTGSAILALATRRTDLMQIMMALGLMIMALITIVLSTWANNTSNLYSTSLTLATVWESPKHWKLTIGASAVGTVVAVGGISNYLLEFFLWLGIVLPPIAGVYLVDFLVLSRAAYAMDDLKRRSPVNAAAFIAWTTGALIGYLSAHREIFLTTIPSVDSIAAAAAMYLALGGLLHRRRARQAPALGTLMKRRRAS